jgi:hypothetical protein
MGGRVGSGSSLRLRSAAGQKPPNGSRLDRAQLTNKPFFQDAPDTSRSVLHEAKRSAGLTDEGRLGLGAPRPDRSAPDTSRSSLHGAQRSAGKTDEGVWSRRSAPRQKRPRHESNVRPTV